MTKVMIDVPDNLHRLVKTIATSHGETMKNFVLRAMESLVKQEVATSNANNNSTTNSTAHEFINEEEADNLLKPYLSALIDNVKNGKDYVMSSEAFFDELKKS
jgi:DNA-directed RNA polymerase